jgi:hypothetical protein
MPEELDILFEGIVRGYQGHGMSGFGYVVVEVEAVTRGVLEAGMGMAFIGPIGPVTRDDGLESELVILCGGDHRPCRNIAEILKDKRVGVGLDGLGLRPVFYDLGAIEEETT